MTPTERAKEIVRGDWTANFCNDNDCITDAEWRRLESIIAAALTEARAEGFRECRRKAEKIARAQKHIPPFDWDSSLEDKLAIYSNRTCEIIAESIEALTPEEK